MFDRSRFPHVRPEIIDAIDRHVCFGLKPGHFVTAALQNDLTEAVSRDSNEGRDLKGIVQYLYNEIPGNAWKSKEHFMQWRSSDNNRTRRKFRGCHPTFQLAAYDQDDERYNPVA